MFRAQMHRALVKAYPHLGPALSVLYTPPEADIRELKAFDRVIHYRRLGHPLSFDEAKPGTKAGAYLLAAEDHGDIGPQTLRDRMIKVYPAFRK